MVKNLMRVALGIGLCAAFCAIVRAQDANPPEVPPESVPSEVPQTVDPQPVQPPPAEPSGQPPEKPQPQPENPPQPVPNQPQPVPNQPQPAGPVQPRPPQPAPGQPSTQMPTPPPTFHNGGMKPGMSRPQPPGTSTGVPAPGKTAPNGVPNGAPNSNVYVEFELGSGEDVWGTFVVELYPDKAPRTVQNFLAYVDRSFYDGTIIHRLVRPIDGLFIAQGGGYVAFGQKKTDGLQPPIPNEATNGLKNERGTIAVARGRESNSGTSQFFFNLQDNPAIDAPNPDGFGYCVFGKVVSGISVMDRLKTITTMTSQAVKNERSQPRKAPTVLHVKRTSAPPVDGSSVITNRTMSPKPMNSGTMPPTPGANPPVAQPQPQPQPATGSPFAGKTSEERRAEARKRIEEQRALNEARKKTEEATGNTNPNPDQKPEGGEQKPAPD